MSNQYIAEQKQERQTALTVHYGAFDNPECPCVFLYPPNFNEPHDIIQQTILDATIKQGRIMKDVRR